MTPQFQVYKEGRTTEGKVLIFSKHGEPFNRQAKIEKYLFLGYKVYDLNGKEIKK